MIENTEEEVRNRFKEIMSFYNIPQGVPFAKKLDVKIMTMNYYLNGRTKTLSSLTLIKLLNVFPDIDINWLLTGKGSMFKKVFEYSIKDIIEKGIIKIQIND